MAANALKPDGAIEQYSASITGAVDGENVTIQGSRFLRLQSFVLSGTLSSNVLTLTGAQSVPLAFKRSTPAEFQARVEELNTRSQSIVKAKAAAQTQLRTLEAQRRFVAEIDRLIGRMRQFDSQADVHSGRFLGAEKGCEGVTAKIAAFVAKERKLAGNSNAEVARGQLSVAANQASIGMDQWHNQVESLQSSLETDVKPMANESVTLEQQCRTLAQSPGILTPQEIENVNAACDRLEFALGPFRQKFSAMSAGLAHLEQVYQRERNAQQELIRESERLE
jgi:transposase-like protein